MRVFKFGGASVKDAEGIKNVYDVLQKVGYEDVLLVVSAMGKTTNALEVVIKNYFDKSAELKSSVQEVKKYHNQIVMDLFDDEKNEVFAAVNSQFADLEYFLAHNKSPNYNFVYDQIVSYGELISTTILSQFMNFMGIKTQWLDVRNYIKTDANYRDAEVDWDLTQKNISNNVKRKILNITQGFLGSDENNFTTTLGREGSDYTAAIFAYCLNAESVTIWKDVPGVMTGDPRKFENVSLLPNISYEDAIEMAYYGASVIHPKTLQPLKQKNIPFYVKSFLQPDQPGTRIGSSEQRTALQSFILKENQHMLRIATRDFSFIAEEHMSLIFSLLAAHRIKISLIQNSAISLDLCLEDKYGTLDALTEDLQKGFTTEIIRNVSLYTVRNANLEDLNKIYGHKTVLLEQMSQKTVQAVTK